MSFLHINKDSVTNVLERFLLETRTVKEIIYELC